MLINAFISFFNSIILGLSELLQSVFSILPDSPFQDIGGNSFFNSVSGYVNYIIPFQSIMIIFSTWLTAIVLFYASMVLLRWIKAIE